MVWLTGWLAGSGGADAAAGDAICPAGEWCFDGCCCTSVTFGTSASPTDAHYSIGGEPEPEVIEFAIEEEVLGFAVADLEVEDDEVLDFVGNVMVGEAPLDEAEMSIVEIRTLGGEAQKGRRIPSGNCHNAFFVDLVTLYDVSAKSPAERQAIVDLTNRVVDKSRAMPGLGVDFSGTHSQPDDIDRSAVAAEIFGSREMAAMIQTQKRNVDPNNRFRFNPYAKFVS